jgi:hypothetical protein
MSGLHRFYRIFRFCTKRCTWSSWVRPAAESLLPWPHAALQHGRTFAAIRHHRSGFARLQAWPSED